MKLSHALVVTLLTPRLIPASTRRHLYSTYNFYVLEHDPNSSASLADVALALGVEIVGQVGELHDHWLVRSEKAKLAARDKSQQKIDLVLDRLENLRLQAASLLPRSEDVAQAHAVISSVRYLARQTLSQRIKRAPPPVRPPKSAASVAERLSIKDPMFPKQWHLVNNEYPEHMMNVAPVWEMGITGKGIISSVVDDGLDFTNDDLTKNFDPENSYDFNDHEELPYPKKSNDHHGTRCAGQIAAGKNDHCGVGIAYDSKIAAVRILSDPISDVDEAAALNYGYQNVSVYSCSWGPRDNGKAMGAPSYLIKKAVLNGINNGRAGKGSIFVFASGNGGGHEDQCNYDGYTNSIYSVTVGALDYTGKHPWYSEGCAANMIVAYSSGSGQHIVTTDKGKGKCSTTHGGTSAAAPNAAAVFVLALQARPDLTWRDIQYLAVDNAMIVDPKDPEWELTASGRLYSYKYGYGALDGYKFVTAAQQWKLVKPQAWFDSPTIQLMDGKMDGSGKYSGGQHIGPGGVESTITITEDILKANNFESLEHITIQVWIDHGRRGDVEVELVSPNNIKSVLGKKRSGDDAKTGFPGWVFMSVKHWCENPIGIWTLRVFDQASNETGKLLGWRMIFWGMTIDPSRAEKYSLPLVDDILPPVEDPHRPDIAIPTITQSHPKPTAYFDDPVTTSMPFSSNTAVAVSTESENGLLTDMLNTLEEYKIILSGAGGAVFIGIVAGFMLLRRRANALKNYTALEADDHQMTSLEAEATRQSPQGWHSRESLTVGLGFHSGFLEDEDMSSSGTNLPAVYRDEPGGEDLDCVGSKNTPIDSNTKSQL